MTTTRLGPFAGIAGTCLIFFAVGCAGNRDQSTASAVTWPDAGEPHPDAGERADSGTITFQDAGSRGADAPVVASDSAPDPSTMDAAVDSIVTFAADTGGEDSAGGGDDAPPAVDSSVPDTGIGPVTGADVTWGAACLYNFGSSCPFAIQQECGNHQAINVTMPNGPQLLNATLFGGLDCGSNEATDNFNDSQRTLGTALWMFTDDADVAGVSASNPTSAIWWIGPLTEDGMPPPGAPTSGCINYTMGTPMCQ